MVIPMKHLISDGYVSNQGLEKGFSSLCVSSCSFCFCICCIAYAFVLWTSSCIISSVKKRSNTSTGTATCSGSNTDAGRSCMWIGDGIVGTLLTTRGGRPGMGRTSLGGIARTTRWLGRRRGGWNERNERIERPWPVTLTNWRVQRTAPCTH